MRLSLVTSHNTALCAEGSKRFTASNNVYYVVKRSGTKRNKGRTEASIEAEKRVRRERVKDEVKMTPSFDGGAICFAVYRSIEGFVLIPNYTRRG